MKEKTRAGLDYYYGTTPPYLLSRADRLSAAGITAFFFLLYLFTCSHHVNVTGDSPELLAGSYSLGILHPPGYPLFTLLGYVFTHIPVGSFAFRLNFLSVLVHSLTLFLLYLSLVKMTRSRAASAIAVSMLGFSYLFWFYSLVAEVFPLNDLFAALLIYVSIRVREKWISGDHEGSRRLFFFLAFLCGLSMAHHYTILFVFPAVLMFTVLPLLDVVKRPGRLLACFALFLAGLLPYIYLPISAARNPYLNFGDPSSLKNFIDVILRRYYGSTTLWRGPSALHRLDLVFDFANTLGKAVYIPGIALGAIGIFHAARKRLGDFIPLFTTLALTGFLFPFMANVSLRSAFDIATIERFYLLPLIVFTYFIGMGVGVVIAWVKSLLRRFPSLDGSWKGLAWLLVLLCVVTPLASFYANAYVAAVSFAIGLAAAVVWGLHKARNRDLSGFGNALTWSLVLLLALTFLLPAVSTCEDVNLRYDYFGDAYMRNLLSSVEDGGLLFVQGDIDIQLLEYYETVLKGDKEIIIIIYNFLVNPWYVKTMRKWYPDLKLPGRADIQDKTTGLKHEIQAWLVDFFIRNNPQITGFHILTEAPELSDRYQFVPWGITFKLIPKGQEIDMDAYLVSQREYWRNFDCRGMNLYSYGNNRREWDYIVLSSAYPQKAAKFLAERGYRRVAVTFYQLAYGIAPVPVYLKELADLYLELDQKANAVRYMADFLASTSIYDPSMPRNMSIVEGLLTAQERESEE